MKTPIETNGGAQDASVFASKDLLGDAVQILKLVRMKYGNLHDPTCAFVKSSRRKWGRTEPCNCWIVERNQAIARIINEYEKLR